MMAEKSRLSTSSTIGVKQTSIAAQLKRSSHRDTTSNPLSKYTKHCKHLASALIEILCSAEDGQEEQVDVENLLGIEDLEKLRLQGFVRDL